MREVYGSSLRFLRHYDLHTGLLEHLKTTEGYPAKINLETEVTNVDCAKGTLQTRDGLIVEKDVLVLANGLGVSIFAIVVFLIDPTKFQKKCRFLNLITGTDCPLIDTELTFFRYLTPAKGLDNSPDIRHFFDNEDDDICFFNSITAGLSIVTYLCEGGKTRVINVVANRPPSNGGKAGT